MPYQDGRSGAACVDGKRDARDELLGIISDRRPPRPQEPSEQRRSSWNRVQPCGSGLREPVGSAQIK